MQYFNKGKGPYYKHDLLRLFSMGVVETGMPIATILTLVPHFINSHTVFSCICMLISQGFSNYLLTVTVPQTAPQLDNSITNKFYTKILNRLHFDIDN